ncbi:MAG TPA: FtsH protease activity modulator HflK, partial [Halothiobacillus sp.]|nr:FtsH protease activity modulator HflK [Halothiobacillus sp.]
GSGGLTPKSIGIIIAVAFGIWMATGIYIVDEGQRGVVTQFGKYHKTSMPGPHWQIPYPVHRVEMVDVDEYRDKRLRMPVLTLDENIVEVALATQFNIKDPVKYLFNVRNPDSTLQDVMQSAVREVIGASNMDFVLTEGRVELVGAVRARMQELLDGYETGLQLQSVNLQDVQPPEAVQPAFEDAIRAREDEQRFINEAMAYANRVVPQARGEAAQIVEEARGYRSRVVMEAEGEASRFESLLAEYRRAPEVTRERMYIDAMSEVLERSNKVFLDVQSGNSLMYLPLDKLMERGVGAAAAVPSITPPISTSSSTPTRPNNTQQRNDSRTRGSN